MKRRSNDLVVRAARFATEALERRLLLTSSVSTAVTNFGGAQQELDYTLTAGVNQYQFTGAFALVDLLQNQVVNDMDLWVDDTSATAPVVTWPYYTSAGNPDGVLHDGHYEGVLENGAFFSAAHVLSFSVYRGDADGDHDVDFQDLAVYAQHVNTAGTYSQGDFNYDGTVDFNDLAILAQKYGTSLAAIPANPNELTSGSATSSSISLNFTAPIDPSTGVASTLFTGFRVYRSSNGLDFMQVSSDSDTSLLRDGSPVYTWTNTGRVDGTKYYYRVRPYNTDTGNGAPTGDWHTTNKVWSVTVLPAPDTLTATRTSASNVGLSWADHSVTETTYEIQRARNSSFTSGVTTFTTSAGSGTRTWTDTTATGAGSYFYRVRGTNSVQQSAYTLPVSVTTSATNSAPTITGSPSSSMQVSPLDGFPSTLTLEATVRDFQPSGVAGTNDFEHGPTGVVPGLVEETLGTDGTPVLASSHVSGAGAIADSTSFYNWYHDSSDTQKTTIGLTFNLDRTEAGVPIYRFAPSGEFLPINGRLWGNQNRGNTVNGNFTLEAHTQFTYHANASSAPNFIYHGDDDVWVFINHKLVGGTDGLDLGGIHEAADGHATLDATRAAELGIVDGGTYDFDFFYAERDIGTSALIAETSIPIFGDYQYKAHLTATDLDAGDTLTWAVLEPQTATITPASGSSPLESELVYVPTSDDLGTTKHFVVAVSDGHDGNGRFEWDVNFSAAADAPPVAEFSSAPDLTGTVGSTFEWDGSDSFTDPDDDEIHFLASGEIPLPDGMSLTEGGLFTWNPQLSDVGLHHVYFLVSDNHGGILLSSFSVNITSSDPLPDITISALEDVPSSALAMSVIDAGDTWTIPYTTSTGDITSVEVVSPRDESGQDLAHIGQDYAGTILPTGDVEMHFYTPAPYGVRVWRGATSTWYSVNANTGLGGGYISDDILAKLPYVLHKNPVAQLVLIADNGPDDKFTMRARPFYPNAVVISNLADAIAAIEEHAELNNYERFSLMVIGHGAAGAVSIGYGTPATQIVPGSAIANEAEDTEIDLETSDFEICLDLFCSSVYFASCDAARIYEPDPATHWKDDGADLCQDVADAATDFGPFSVYGWDNAICFSSGANRPDGFYAVDGSSRHDFVGH